MNEAGELPHFGSKRTMLLGGALLVIILGGAVVARLFSPSQQALRHQPAKSSQVRSIVQIVRQQPGLPDFAELIDGLCPSLAIIVPHDSDQELNGKGNAGIPAAVYSTDGWLIASVTELAQMPLDAVFGDGRRARLTDLRRDPVSGLAIVKADLAAAPLAFSDQAFPRVGQFGLSVTTPKGSGCTAALSIIGSDFLADGGAEVGYVRLRPVPDDWTSGTPLLGADGKIIGIGTDGRPGEIIPAPIASVIIDELIRNSLSATTNFGFRTIDYAAPVAARLGDIRSGAGVAFVQPGSFAEKAGLHAGDVITSVDDRPVSSASELDRLLDVAPTEVRLATHRGSKQMRLTIRRSAR